MTGPALMATETNNALAFTFADAQRAQLQDWMRVSTSAKIDFFEEMIELAYRSGALTPERLALRDAPPSPRGRGTR